MRKLVEEYTRRVIDASRKYAMEDPFYRHNPEEIRREIEEDARGCTTVLELICRTLKKGGERIRAARARNEAMGY